MRTQLAPASARTRIKKFLRASLSIAFVLLIASTFDGWLRYAGYTFGALVAVVLEWRSLPMLRKYLAANRRTA